MSLVNVSDIKYNCDFVQMLPFTVAPSVVYSSAVPSQHEDWVTLVSAGGSLVLGRFDSGGWHTGSLGGEGRSGKAKIEGLVT